MQQRCEGGSHVWCSGHCTGGQMQRVYCGALAEIVEKYDLDVSLRTSLHSRWLAAYLWGDYSKERRYPKAKVSVVDGKPWHFLVPPRQEWRCRSQTEAFRCIVKWPRSLMYDLIDSFIYPWRGKPSANDKWARWSERQEEENAVRGIQ
jgi:hypothetical protein